MSGSSRKCCWVKGFKLGEVYTVDNYGVQLETRVLREEYKTWLTRSGPLTSHNPEKVSRLEYYKTIGSGITYS